MKETNESTSFCMAKILTYPRGSKSNSLGTYKETFNLKS